MKLETSPVLELFPYVANVDPSFFFLANNIPYVDEVVEFAKWGEEKQRLIASGESPMGYLPIVYDGDQAFTEHHSIVRYYATKVGLYGKEYGEAFSSSHSLPQITLFTFASRLREHDVNKSLWDLKKKVSHL